MSANDIIALLRGEPGPFLEDEKGFFGKKRVDSSMKEAPMETDMGGMMITKAKMTYGEADALAPCVDLTDYPAFVEKLEPCCYWRSPREKTQPEGRYFIGEVWWSIYSYLATKRYIEGKPERYNNTLEYLFDEVLKRLVKAEVWFAEENGRWFNWPEKELTDVQE